MKVYVLKEITTRYYNDPDNLEIMGVTSSLEEAQRWIESDRYLDSVTREYDEFEVDMFNDIDVLETIKDMNHDVEAQMRVAMLAGYAGMGDGKDYERYLRDKKVREGRYSGHNIT